MRNLRKLQYIYLIFIAFSCSERAQDPKRKESKPAGLKHVETKRIKFQDLNVSQIDPCDTFSIEVDGIYPDIDTINLAHLDTAYLDNDLKNRGFETINSGWGSFQEGPRILSIELSNGECNCKVFKKYIAMRSIGENGETRDYCHIIERMVCNALNNGVD